jgi:hypothetical protein
MKFTKIWWSISIASVLVLSLSSGSALADTGVKLPKLDLRGTRLDNGLRVILVLDHGERVILTRTSGSKRSSILRAMKL